MKGKSPRSTQSLRRYAQELGYEALIATVRRNLKRRDEAFSLMRSINQVVNILDRPETRLSTALRFK